MSLFCLGTMAGGVIGACLGVLIMCMLILAGRVDRAAERQRELWTSPISK